MVNMTCPTIPDKPSDPKPFFENGNIDFKAHNVGWLLCGIMALIATISSFWLIWKHLTYYTCPQQQRHIVRLLIMVPIYAIVSFMSYLFYHKALYYQTIRDCYEAVLVTSFFYLILAYTGDTRAEQHAVFRNIEIKDHFWVWPLGSWKYKPEGLHFLWLMKICVLQYAIFRPLCTFIAVATEYFGYYCLHSWMPWFTHVWCALIISISVTVAMYCLIQLYIPVRKLVDPYKPILKFLAIKTIVFLTFWQDTLLSFLVSFNVIKETEYFTAEQIQAGINALLQCFWMLLFGFIHIKAFSYLPYRPEDRSRTTLRGKALLDSLDFSDWFVEMKQSTRYMAARSKGRNYTLAEDLRAKRHQHLLNALGKQRSANLDAEMDMEKAAMPTFWKNPEDAQFWTPGDESDSGYNSSKNANSEVKPSSRTRDGGYDAYTSLPNPVGGRSSKFIADKSATTASRDSHKQRTAELQRLVAELDLQDVDPSIVGAQDQDYGYEDEKYERAALITRQSGFSKDLETPRKELHPELTQYHTPTIQLANVPSLSYDHDSNPGSNSESDKRGKKDLSAVAEEEEDEHVVNPGIGAFGIAAWLGWSNSTPQPAHAATESDHFLHPGGTYGARVAATTPDAEGTGWWKTYWDRVSNPGSREPSIAGMEEEEKQPRPAVIRQVTAGSWGVEPNSYHHQQQVSRATTLKIDTHPNHNGDGQSLDSANSPSTSSVISPHVNSPLSRLIQTSRDSFSSLNRDEIRDQLLASTNSRTWAKQQAEVQSPAVKPSPIPFRPNLAPQNPSLAPSSNKASVSRVPTTSDRRSTPTITSHYSSAISAAREKATEMLSSTDKHPVKFVDALLPPLPSSSPSEEVEGVKSGNGKVLPPAIGPKGKLVNLVLPNPLSPARFPYGQEATVQPETNSSSSVSRIEASAVQSPAETGSGTLKWVQQPKPIKTTQEAPTSKPKLPEGKGLITVGALSLAQHKALAAQPQSPTHSKPISASAASEVKSKSILTSGKLVLPAPSKLATIETDPYTPALKQKQKEEKKKGGEGGGGGVSVTTSGQSKMTITATAFEVGSIVPRSAVVRASMGGGGLGGYYDSIRSQQRGSWVGERHSYVPPGFSGVRPAMLPAHPSHLQQVYANQSQPQYTARPQYPDSSPSHLYPQPQQQPYSQPQSSQSQFATRPSQPLQQFYPPNSTSLHQARNQAQRGASQFQFEYYRD